MADAAESADSMIDAYRAEIKTQTERAERYKRALQEIADADYRGNRSPESEIAFRALTTVKP